MTTKRFLEITAKSEAEAREIVKRELNPDETIGSAQILSAPARGMFGVVGNPEVRVRFAIEALETPAVPHDDVESVNEPADDTDDLPKDEFDIPRKQPRVRRAVSESADGTMRKRPFRQRSDEKPGREDRIRFSGTVSTRKREPVTDEIKNHPCYQNVFEMLKEIAANLGVENAAFNDWKVEDSWQIEASGTNISQLIGKRGRMLDAIQYILNICVNKGQKNDKLKLVLDVQGYREKRQRGLVQLANRMYRKVIDTSRQVELEPMSTIDRRTIHIALKDRTGIETFSRGIEPMRRVIIAPKKLQSQSPEWQPADESSYEETPARTRSVPMFIEEDQGNEK